MFTPVDVDIQEGFLKRRGWMGGLLTLYVHRYSGGSEVSGRDHNHPWRLVFSVMLRGGYTDHLNGRPRLRRAFNVHWYRNEDRHSLKDIKPGTVTLFLGLLRSKRTGPCYNRMTRHGAAHYSELIDVPIDEVPLARAAG